MSVLTTILNDFGKGAKAVWDQTTYAQQARERNAEREAADNDFVDLIQQKGGRFVHGDTVMDDDGNLRPVDKTRVVSHKTRQGETLRFELPTIDEQMRTANKRLLDQYHQQAGLRDEQAQDAANQAGQQEGARLAARNADRQTRLADEGIDIPDALDQVLPGMSKNANGTRRRVLPENLDNLITSTGSFSNMLHRNDPKPRSIKSVEKIEGKDGKTTLAITYDDGQVEEKPLAATGKGASAASEGGLTPYQQFEISDKLATRKQAAIKTQQDALDKLQTEETGLLGKNEELMRRRSENKAKLGFVEGDVPDPSSKDGKMRRGWIKDNEGDPDLTKSQRGAISEQIAKDEAEIAKNNARIQAIQPQKKTVDAVRRGLMGQAQQAQPLKQRTQGNFVIVTDPNGQEHTFPNAEAAQQFQDSVAQAQRAN